MSIPRPYLRGMRFTRTYTCISCLEEECRIINQSGSSALRPLRLPYCCFPLNRRQISSDISSPLFATARKNMNFYRTSMATEQVGVRFRKCLILARELNISPVIWLRRSYLARLAGQHYDAINSPQKTYILLVLRKHVLELPFFVWMVRLERRSTSWSGSSWYVRCVLLQGTRRIQIYSVVQGFSVKNPGEKFLGSNVRGPYNTHNAPPPLPERGTMLYASVGTSAVSCASNGMYRETYIRWCLVRLSFGFGFHKPRSGGARFPLPLFTHPVAVNSKTPKTRHSVFWQIQTFRFYLFYPCLRLYTGS